MGAYGGGGQPGSDCRLERGGAVRCRARDAGDLWIAPLAEIADRQQAVAQVHVEEHKSEPVNADSFQAAPLRLVVTNRSARNLAGLTLRLPFDARRATVQHANGAVNPLIRGATLVF